MDHRETDDGLRSFVCCQVSGDRLTQSEFRNGIFCLAGDQAMHEHSCAFACEVPGND